MKVRWDVPVGLPLDLSTPKGMICIGTYVENCKSDNVSKYHVPKIRNSYGKSRCFEYIGSNQIHN